MTNDEMHADIDALDAQGLTALFEKIGDHYQDGMMIPSSDTETRASAMVLVEALLVRRIPRTQRFEMTGRGYAVSTRIAALGGLRCVRSEAA